MSQEKFAEVQRALTELHSTFAQHPEQAILIQTDGLDVTVAIVKGWWGIDRFDVPDLELIISCATIYGISCFHSLDKQLEKLETKNQYSAILEKVKSAGLTDDEIKILQEGNN
jgi:hypothetical protein